MDFCRLGSFVEAVLGDSAHYPFTYRTLMETELLVLRATSMQEALQDHTSAMEAIRNAALLIRMEAAGESTGFYEDAAAMNPDELEVMVARKSVMGGDALVINLEKCVRCNACVESCVAVHDDGVPRLSKKGFRVGASNNELGADINLATSCYSCEAPGCMMSCSYGAIRRDTAGLIRFVWDNCTGCAMCTSACPYDVIRLTPPPGEQAQAQSQAAGALSKLPLIGGLFRKAPAAPTTEERKGFHKQDEARGKAVKCDRCEGLPFEACVYNCPCGAIERVPPSLLFKDIFSYTNSGSGGGGQS